MWFSQLHASPTDDHSLFEPLPESLVGMPNGTLQPENTMRFFLGSAQTSPASSGRQTGRQVYFGGAHFRSQTPLQFGTSFTLFDDIPASAINNREDSLSYIALGSELKYQLHNSKNLSAALLTGIELTYFSRGMGITTQSSVSPEDRDQFIAGTISIPVTYRVAAPLWMTGELGYTHATTSLNGATGFGARGFVSLGVGYQASKRLSYYASAKELIRETENSIDAPEKGAADRIYTFGGRFSLTPQSAVNLYITNAFSPTALGDDFLFFPDKNEAVFGVLLSYSPSGRGVGKDALTFHPASSSSHSTARFSDGIAIRSPHTLPPDSWHSSLSTGSTGHLALSLAYSPDPHLQFQISIEDYALGSGADFRSETEEDLRYQLGAYWQAMDEGHGHPFNLGFGLSASRDFQKPSIGSLFAETSLSRIFDWGEATFNIRRALYTANAETGPYRYERKTRTGAGALLRYDFSESISALSEFTLLSEDEPLWALGVRYSPDDHPFAIDLYSSNAAGSNDIGTLLSNNAPHIGMTLHWVGHLDFM